VADGLGEWQGSCYVNRHRVLIGDWRSASSLTLRMGGKRAGEQVAEQVTAWELLVNRRTVLISASSLTHNLQNAHLDAGNNT
jgi:hypothetical protein